MRARKPILQAEPILKPDLVRQMLLSVFAGDWRTGDRLLEVELAERFGVSRTPVREALQELAAIGIIELRPNCGAVMRTFGSRQVREIYQVREILEVEATRMACGRLEPNKLDLLQRRFEVLLETRLRDAAWAEKEWTADRNLHDMIAAACGNERLSGEIDRYGKLVQVIRETVGNQRDAQAAATADHIEILKALIANRPTAAAEAMRRHLRGAADAAVLALEPNLRSADSPRPIKLKLETASSASVQKKEGPLRGPERPAG